MSDELDLLDDTLRSIFARRWTREDRLLAGGDVPAHLWKVLDESGLTALAMADSGAGLPELVALASAVGRAAAPVPLVEMSGLASWLLGSARLPLPSGITTCAAAHPDDQLRLTRSSGGWSVDGVLHRVPWGSSADHVVALASSHDGALAVVLPTPSAVKSGRNHAGEQRDTLSYASCLVAADQVAPSGVDTDAFALRGALLRSASMAGAMERVLEMTLQHAEDREQFGRPISAFQAVQGHLVAIAEETVCAGMAVRAASVAGEHQEPLAFAAAKVIAGMAADVVTARAHQVHGAIGTTDEHALHWYTTRLWSWQDEFGSADTWAGQIGCHVVSAGAEQLWPTISTSLQACRPDLATSAANAEA